MKTGFDRWLSNLNSKTKTIVKIRISTAASINICATQCLYISDYHQGIGGLEPEHVAKEVLGQFAILVVVVRVTCEGGQDHEEQDQDGEDLQEFGRQVQTEGSQEVSKREEGEELDIHHDQDLEEHPPEGVGSEEDADLEVKLAAKESVEEDEEQDSHGQSKGEVVESTRNKKITLPFLVEVGRIGVNIVL